MLLVQQLPVPDVLLNVDVVQQRQAVLACAFSADQAHVERQAAVQALKRGDIDVLIGSTILDERVDVPAVGMVILAGGGKEEAALRQRIGRDLREKKNGMPNVCLIVDFTDDFNNHLKNNAKQRLHIVKSTEGFGENIVADFPFAEVGLRRRVTAA